MNKWIEDWSICNANRAMDRIATSGGENAKTGWW